MARFSTSTTSSDGCQGISDHASPLLAEVAKLQVVTAVLTQPDLLGVISELTTTVRLAATCKTIRSQIKDVASYCLTQAASDEYINSGEFRQHVLGIVPFPGRQLTLRARADVPNAIAESVRCVIFSIVKKYMNKSEWVNDVRPMTLPPTNPLPDQRPRYQKIIELTLGFCRSRPLDDYSGCPLPAQPSSGCRIVRIEYPPRGLLLPGGMYPDLKFLWRPHAFTEVGRMPALRFLWLEAFSDAEILAISNMILLESLFIDVGSRRLNLEPLQNLTNLTKLHIYQRKCTARVQINFNFLRALTAVEELNLDAADFTDSMVLSDLTRLQKLSLVRARLQDLVGLAGLVNLEFLDCRESKVTDLTPLGSLPALRYLDIMGTEVTRIMPVARNPKLHLIEFTENKLVDLDDFKKIRKFSSKQPSRAYLEPLL